MVGTLLQLWGLGALPSGEDAGPALFDCSLIHVRIRQHPVDSKFEAQAVLAVGLHGPRLSV